MSKRLAVGVSNVMHMLCIGTGPARAAVSRQLCTHVFAWGFCSHFTCVFDARATSLFSLVQYISPDSWSCPLMVDVQPYSTLIGCRCTIDASWLKGRIVCPDNVYCALDATNEYHKDLIIPRIGCFSALASPVVRVRAKHHVRASTPEHRLHRYTQGTTTPCLCLHGPACCPVPTLGDIDSGLKFQMSPARG